MFDTSMSVDGFMTAEFVELYNRYRPHRALAWNRLIHWPV
jgi:hypothetical protein